MITGRGCQASPSEKILAAMVYPTTHGIRTNLTHTWCTDGWLNQWCRVCPDGVGDDPAAALRRQSVRRPFTGSPVACTCDESQTCSSFDLSLCHHTLIMADRAWVWDTYALSGLGELLWPRGSLYCRFAHVSARSVADSVSCRLPRPRPSTVGLFTAAIQSVEGSRKSVWCCGGWSHRWHYFTSNGYDQNLHARGLAAAEVWISPCNQ